VRAADINNKECKNKTNKISDDVPAELGIPILNVMHDAKLKLKCTHLALCLYINVHVGRRTLTEGVGIIRTPHQQPL
jgi:hypothetical protein